MSVSLICSNCGSSVEEYSKECIHCGMSIETVSDVILVEERSRGRRVKTYAQLLAEGKTDDDIVRETVQSIEQHEQQLRKIRYIIWHIIYLIGGVAGIVFITPFSGNSLQAFSFGIIAIAALLSVTQVAGGTTIVVPAVVVGTMRSVTDDMIRARQRMFDKFWGPLLGFIYGGLFYLISISLMIL